MSTKMRIALAGNPNCGKTCIFNALTGARQHVGNYPGVTVESKTGHFTLDEYEIELIDLPGVYSLSSSSPEEEVVFQELTKPGIDLILNVVDSTIPRRSLYLTTQLAELHIPMMLVFNMSDDAAKKGMKFDIPKLEKYFGSPIVQTIGSKTDGVRPLLSKLTDTLKTLADHGSPMLSYGNDIDETIQTVAEAIEKLALTKYAHIPARFFAIKLLEHNNSVMGLDEFKPVHTIVNEEIAHLRSKHAIDDAETFMADRRYAMLSGACRDTIKIVREDRRREISDKIDAVVTNKYLALPIFFAVIYATFWFTFICADPLMGYIEDFFGWLAGVIGGAWNENTMPFLREMIIDGIIGGVGGVIVFLPNIVFLFFAIAILEDSGYMARAAFVMDGIMRRFGLQGRSFVPLVLGFGCTVPAIMATRTIESERDRKVTIMVLPLMSCSARLPIYALIIPAFFAVKYQASVMWLIYVIGIAIALIAARIMKSTLFKGDGEVYLMELPPYRMPTLKSLCLHMWDRSKMYLHKAGTIILVTSIILFFCNTYPKKEVFSHDYDAAIETVQKKDAFTPAEIMVAKSMPGMTAEQFKEVQDTKTLSAEYLESLDMEKLNGAQKALAEKASALQEKIADYENAKQAEVMEYTISGRIGKLMTYVMAPIGFDWRLSTASIGALAAKEVFVSQLGILFAQGETDEESESLREILVRNYTPLQAFCVMIFCLLSIPCLATLAIIKRELNSWKMAFIEAGGLFLLAYVVTFVVYHLGNLLNIGNKLL